MAYGCTLIPLHRSSWPQIWEDRVTYGVKMMSHCGWYLPLHTSLLDIYKVFELLVCCLKGIRFHPYPFTPTKLAPEQGIQGPEWSENDAIALWLTLIWYPTQTASYIHIRLPFLFWFQHLNYHLLLIVESKISCITTFLQNLVFGIPLPIASALVVELATNSATRAPTLVVFESVSTFQIRINLNWIRLYQSTTFTN